MRCEVLERELKALAAGLRSERAQQYFRAQGPAAYREFTLLRIQLSALAEEWGHASPESIQPPALPARQELWRTINGLFFALERLTDPYEIIIALTRVVGLAFDEVGLVT